MVTIPTANFKNRAETKKTTENREKYFLFVGIIIPLLGKQRVDTEGTYRIY